MTQRYWPTYGKSIRDKLVSLIQARATADSVTVGEILAGLGTGRHTFQATGIYVLPPALQPLGGNENTPTDANETELEYPVLVRCTEFQEGDYLEDLGRLVSLVVDAIEATPYFSTTSGATVEQAYIRAVERPELLDGAGAEVPAWAMCVVLVVCKVCRSTS